MARISGHRAGAQVGGGGAHHLVNQREFGGYLWIECFCSKSAREGRPFGRGLVKKYTYYKHRLYIYIWIRIESRDRINHQTLDVVPTPHRESFTIVNYSPGRTLVFDTFGRIFSPKINAVPLIYHSIFFRFNVPRTLIDPNLDRTRLGGKCQCRPYTACRVITVCVFHGFHGYTVFEILRSTDDDPKRPIAGVRLGTTRDRQNRSSSVYRNVSQIFLNLSLRI